MLIVKRNEFIVTYQPLGGSNICLESLEFGEDVDIALEEFKLRHPAARTVGVSKPYELC
jgi:hypothetical protein